MNAKSKKLCWTMFFIAIYVILGIILSRMFFRQAVGYAGLLGNYEGDLPDHISSGRNGEGYSLIEYAFGFLMNVLQLKEWSVGVLLAFIVLATAWVTYRLMCKLVPEGNYVVLHLLAMASCFVMPIYLKDVNPHRYLGLQPATVWHNSTYIAMKLAGICLLFFYFSYQETYQEHFSVSQFVWFTILLIIVNMVKPNFIICFAPAMAVILLMDFISARGRTILRQIEFGIPVLLSLVVLIWQSSKLYGGGTESSLMISFAYMLRLNTWHPVASLLQSAAFPLLVLLVNFRSLKTDRSFRVSWLIWLFGLLEYLFLIESGTRRDHGNLTWGYSWCMFLVFIISICWLYKDIAKLYRDYKDSGMKSAVVYLRERALGRAVYVVAALILFGVHLWCGLQFFRLMYLGQAYSMI